MAFRFTKPIGTVVRTWPDWRLDEQCIGSYGLSNSNPALFMYISLFNNASDGSSLVVWNLIVSVDSFNFMNFYLYKGHRGTAVPSCTNVSPLRAVLWGQMYVDTPGSKYTDVPIVSNGTLIAVAWPANYPSVVIPAGWSLAVGSDLAGSDTSMAAWYLPTPGI